MIRLVRRAVYLTSPLIRGKIPDRVIAVLTTSLDGWGAVEDRLIIMNDDERKSFNKIAAWVEEHL